MPNFILTDDEYRQEQMDRELKNRELKNRERAKGITNENVLLTKGVPQINENDPGGKDTKDDAADKATKGMESSGNPYLTAAGLGIETLSMDAQLRNKQKQLEYQAKLEQKDAMTKAYTNLANISQGLARL